MGKIAKQAILEYTKTTKCIKKTFLPENCKLKIALTFTIYRTRATITRSWLQTAPKH